MLSKLTQRQDIRAVHTDSRKRDTPSANFAAYTHKNRGKQEGKDAELGNDVRAATRAV
ncbi:hypothetical protein GCM10009693_20740 [Leucobacter chromiireducens subsp. chromiireducens]